MVTYVVGVGHFAHSVAGSGEVLAAVLTGELPLSSYGTWVAGAVLGNSAGRRRSSSRCSTTARCTSDPAQVVSGSIARRRGIA